MNRNVKHHRKSIAITNQLLKRAEEEFTSSDNIICYGLQTQKEDLKRHLRSISA